jgi:hypothetical protein
MEPSRKGNEALGSVSRIRFTAAETNNLLISRAVRMSTMSAETLLAAFASHLRRNDRFMAVQP